MAKSEKLVKDGNVKIVDCGDVKRELIELGWELDVKKEPKKEAK